MNIDPLTQFEPLSKRVSRRAPLLRHLNPIVPLLLRQMGHFTDVNLDQYSVFRSYSP
jgi:hypothetical protein